MKATELRIGNYVNTSERSGWSYQICRQGIIRTLNNGSCNITPLKMISPIITVKYPNVDPIPLNEDWLSKGGFIPDKNGCFWKDCVTHYLELMYASKSWYPIWATLPEFSFEEEQRSTIHFIDSVHELQNLYFALTGEELTITE
jgi:hypothetical protein